MTKKYGAIVWRTFCVVIALAVAGCDGEGPAPAPSAADEPKAASAPPGKVSPERAWFVGTWKLGKNPGANFMTALEFAEDGEAFVILTGDRRMPGTYTVDGATIEILYSNQGRTVPIELTRSDDYQTLYLKSPRTGETSEYRKVGGAAGS